MSFDMFLEKNRMFMHLLDRYREMLGDELKSESIACGVIMLLRETNV